MDRLVNDNKTDAKSFWIIGAGRFGRIAAGRLAAKHPQCHFLKLRRRVLKRQILGLECRL